MRRRLAAASAAAILVAVAVPAADMLNLGPAWAARGSRVSQEWATADTDPATTTTTSTTSTPTSSPTTTEPPTTTTEPPTTTTEPPTTVPTTTTTAPAPRSFSVVAGGDILVERAVRFNAGKAARNSRAERPPRYDFTPLFSPVASLVKSADLAICHMETPVGRRNQRPGFFGKSHGGGNRLLAPYEIAQGVAATGFDRCSTASNHAFDLWETGINSTLDALDEAGLTHAGTARTLTEAQPQIINVNGVRVAHLSYTRMLNNRPPRDRWRIATGYAEKAIFDVNTARQRGAEVVIVSVHTGDEITFKPNADQRYWADLVTRYSDVDLILMHHPHTVAPVERVNGTWVYWSLGNFVSGMGPGAKGRYRNLNTLDGLIASVRFTEDAQNPGRFTLEPAAIGICTSPSNRHVYPATETLARRSISKKLRTEISACNRRLHQWVPAAR
jgi:poly-gamma-glutamate synthesis protein (capsule biosynthesis protein)